MEQEREKEEREGGREGGRGRRSQQIFGLQVAKDQKDGWRGGGNLEKNTFFIHQKEKPIRIPEKEIKTIKSRMDQDTGEEGKMTNPWRRHL